MNRISNLPDDLIYQIISFLSTKEALFLKYASRRFLNLVTIIPNLDFDSSIEIRGCLVYILSGLLSRDASHRIRRFSLKLRYKNFDLSLYNLVNECQHNVLKRGVLDLELDINVKEDYTLPSELFTCKSVVKLKLGSGFVIDLIPKNALLPSLKTLVLDSVSFVDLDGCAFQKLISSACIVLEELVIDRLNWESWNWSRLVFSLTLERFSARREAWEEDGYVRSDYEILSIDAPSLVYLEYNDVLLDGYPFVNLDSIVEAKLYLPERQVVPNPYLMNLIKGLKNVRNLHLDNVDTMPVLILTTWFENMSHLSIQVEPVFCWEGLQVILKKSPNLKCVTIIGTLHYTDRPLRYQETVCECLLGYSFLLTCTIEFLKITEFEGHIGEMVQIKHVLEKLPCLELLELDVQTRRDDQKLKIMEGLLMFPRGSSTCQVKVKFS